MRLLGKLPAVLLIGGAVLLVAPIVLLRLTGGGFYTMPSDSMAPILPRGSAFLSWPIADGEMPSRGAVVVFEHPQRPGVDFVKRLIGRPGDRVAVVDGVVQLDGVPLSTDPAGHVQMHNGGGRSRGLTCSASGADSAQTCTAPAYRETLPGGASYLVLDTMQSPADNFAEIAVPDGHVFVMGDHRDNSVDSRFAQLGLVPVENLQSTAWRFYLSFQDPAGSVARFLQRVGP